MHYDIPDRLLLQDVADEKVILDPDSGKYFTLDAVGSRMIDLLRATSDLEQTLEHIVAEYDVSAETARTDLNELLEEMAEQGLVQKTGH